MFVHLKESQYLQYKTKQKTSYNLPSECLTSLLIVYPYKLRLLGIPTIPIRGNGIHVT